MRFTVVDFETANARMHSICQIGAVVFENGAEVAAHSILIDPQDYFSGVNISIHGIDEQDVIGQRTFPEIHGWISETLRGEIVVSHTHFDRVALAQACAYHGVEGVTCRWLDSAMVARRAWPRYARYGYGLSSLAQDFNIEFQHHDALHDSRATGLILLRAISETGIDLESWFSRVKQPIIPFGSDVALQANNAFEDGQNFIHNVVFTGALQIVRGEAALLACAAGMMVEDGITKRTTLLVVGDQDVRHLAGNDKSAKHRKAEMLIAKGHPIRIVQESDFMALVNDTANV